MAVTGNEPPTVNSLLIAERVFRDRESGEWIIAGVFNAIHTQQLPAEYPRKIEVFFQITNIGRDVDLHLRIEHSDGDVLLDVGGPITADNPLRVVERRVVLDGVKFPKPGKYWVQLLSREEILTQAPLHIIVVREESNG